MSARHRIDELLFDIAFSSPTLEMTQADALRALVVETLLPVMDQVFDEYADSDAVWQIDALEIDVGNVNEADFPAALAENLRIALEKVLQGDAAKPSVARRIPRSRADVEMLLAFLADGALPWQLESGASDGAASAGAAAAIHESLLQRVLQHSADVLLPALRASSRRSVQVARLVRQFPAAQLQALLHHLAPASADVLVRHVAALQALLQEVGLERFAWSEALYVAWEEIFAVCLEQQGATPSAAAILQSALVKMAAQRQQAVLQVARELIQRIEARRGGFPQDEMHRALAVVADGTATGRTTAASANLPSDDGLPVMWRTLAAQRSDLGLLRHLIGQSSPGMLQASLKYFNPRHADAAIGQIETLERLLGRTGFARQAAAQALSTAWEHVFGVSLTSSPQPPRLAQILEHVVATLVFALPEPERQTRPAILSQLHQTAVSDGRIQELAVVLSTLQDADNVRTDAEAHARGGAGNTGAALMMEKSANDAIPPKERAGMAYEPPSTAVTVRNQVIAALMGGNAGDIYDDWRMFRDSRPELLRSAILHYSGYGEIREKIASTFPLSLLADMLALLAPQAAELTEHVWADPQLRAWLDDEGPDGAARWNNWRRNWWRGAIAYLLQAARAQEQPATIAFDATAAPSAFDMSAYLAAGMESAAPADEHLAEYLAQLQLPERAAGMPMQHAQRHEEEKDSGDNATHSRHLPHDALGKPFLNERRKAGIGLVGEIANDGNSSSPRQEIPQQPLPSPSSLPVDSPSLAQLFEAIRGGAQPSQRWTLSVAQLKQLLHEAVSERSFFQAIVDHASVARDPHTYYVQVLHALAENRIVDLEAFAAIEGGASPLPETTMASSGSAVLDGSDEAKAVSIPHEPENIGERDKAKLIGRLAKALMKGDPAPLYADWDVLLRKHAPLLREALQHYAIRDDILERIALSFPESMLYDMIALLAPAAAPIWSLLRDPETWAAAEREDGGQNSAVDMIATDKALAHNVAVFKAEQIESGEIPGAAMPADFSDWKRKLWQAGLRHVLIRAQEENNPENPAAGENSLPALLKEMEKDATAEPFYGRQAETFFAMLARDAALNQQAWQRRYLVSWQKLAAKSQASGIIAAVPENEENSVHAAAIGITAEPGHPSATTEKTATISDNLDDLREILLHHQRLTVSGESSLLMSRESIPEEVGIDLRQRFARLKNVSLGVGMSMAAADLARVVEAFIAAHGEAAIEQQQTFMQAIAAQAPQAAGRSRERYFRSVLHALLHEQALDLEAIAERSVEGKILPEDEGGTGPHAAVEHMAGQRQVEEGMPAAGVHTAASTESAAATNAAELRGPVETVADKGQAYIDFLLSPGFGSGAGATPDGLANWLPQVLETGAPMFVPVLAKLSGNPAAVERFLALLPAASLPSWSSWSHLFALAPHSPTQLQRMRRYAGDVADMFSEFNRQLAATHLARLEWAFLLPYLFAAGRVFEPSRFAGELLDFLAHRTGTPVSSALTARLRSQMGIAVDVPPTGAGRGAAPHVAVAGAAVNTGADKPGEAAHVPAPAAGETASSATHAETFVPNAGVVLCWPFLSRVWETLGLTQADAFVDEAAAQRAALLLQFIAYEQTAAPEYQLTLNKLLCGVHSKTPMICEIEVTTAESELIEQMLSAMIAHWKMLGNTSIRGLRETFLQRPGYLSLKEDGWHLRVRSGPFDMLMEKLPWSISTIRYPWMEKLLWVQWV